MEGSRVEPVGETAMRARGYNDTIHVSIMYVDYRFGQVTRKRFQFIDVHDDAGVININALLILIALNHIQFDLQMRLIPLRNKFRKRKIGSVTKYLHSAA